MDAQKRGNVKTICTKRSDGLRDVSQVGPNLVLSSATERKRSHVNENTEKGLCHGLSQFRSDNALVSETETGFRRWRRRKVHGGSGPLGSAVTSGAADAR